MSDLPEDLIAAAERARETAYAPYSGYLVGAAVLDEQGRIWEGCNVENVSYPAGLCAERVAIGKMVNGGGRKIAAIAVSTVDGGTPCGICLQTLLEFGDGEITEIFAVDEAHRSTKFKLRDLIPHGFSSKEVKRKNDSDR